MKYSSLTELSDWLAYKTHVMTLNAGFFVALAREHPTLSIYETKLCALILMECETKECHTLLGMTTRAVQSMQWRLKDKFKLKEHETLHAYLVALR